MQENMDIVLDFTHAYSREWLQGQPSLHYLDCSDIRGTDMYCTPEAEQELRSRLAPYPIGGIHFLDSGNYHYMTRLFTQRIGQPYSLVLFDNHNDMQPGMIPELLSCGGWAKQALEEDPALGRLILIGPSQKSMDEIRVNRPEKLVCVSRGKLPEIPDCISGPVYLSIDKDVLSEDYARTNWDQGQMTLPMLKSMVRDIFRRGTVLGVDICGEMPNPPAWQAAEVRHINERVNNELYGFLHEMLAGN